MNTAAARPVESDFEHDPIEISAERFHEMLNILPPHDWSGHEGAQSFKMSEFVYGSVTTIFCQLGTKYYELAGSCRLTHQDILSRCRVATPVA